MRKTGGFQGLLETIFGIGGAVNAFDQFGHFARALVPTNSCFDYTSREQAGCEATFFSATTASAAARALAQRMLSPLDTGGREARAAARSGADARPTQSDDSPADTNPAPDSIFDQLSPPTGGATPGDAERTPQDQGLRTGSMRRLLDFLLGPERGSR
jgi:hypothetical protein